MKTHKDHYKEPTVCHYYNERSTIYKNVFIRVQITPFREDP